MDPFTGAVTNYSVQINRNQTGTLRTEEDGGGNCIESVMDFAWEKESDDIISVRDSDGDMQGTIQLYQSEDGNKSRQWLK